MEELKNLIEKGIVYEDEFIEMYIKLIRDEGFLEAFGGNSDQAKELLNVLIKESEGHKKSLENIINNL